MEETWCSISPLILNNIGFFGLLMNRCENGFSWTIRTAYNSLKHKENISLRPFGQKYIGNTTLMSYHEQGGGVVGELVARNTQYSFIWGGFTSRFNLSHANFERSGTVKPH